MPIDLHAISPDERHLPPSRRTWAREILPRWAHGRRVLEMRDPNDGLDPDPARKTRHQYLVARDRLWYRRLPPAPLEQLDDQSPWADGPARWETALVAADSPAATWAVMHGLHLADLLASPTSPEQVEVERDIHGDGGGTYTAYVMPPVWPWDRWGDITTYAATGVEPAHVVPCPVEGCPGHLQWWEAGYAPGYRVCMTPTEDGTYDPATIQHRFVLDPAREYPGMVLILDQDR